VWMPAAFAVYLASVYAFSFLGPFGYPAGCDLAGGVLAELSGPDRLVLQAGRWLLLAAGAALAVPLFLGCGAGSPLAGWAGAGGGGSGFGVFPFHSMGPATFALLISFLASGGLLIWLGQAYLGTVVILMMVMEMVIMAVFMVAYMMNPAGLMPMSMVHNRRGS